MVDQMTLAYVNLYAVLGSLENLCRIDEEARKCLTNKKPISIGFEVKDGPCAVLTFENSQCSFVPDSQKCDIKLFFKTPEQFNGMINGTFTPFPRKGLFKIRFLTKDFTKLTDRLSALLRATPEQLMDEKFKYTSTLLMCSVITGAVAQIGNHDEVGKFSASNIINGEISFEVADDFATTIVCHDHYLTIAKKKCMRPRAVMRFESMDIARRIFDNEEDSMACACQGKLSFSGMVPMLDNMNRILDRVALYLS